MIVPRAALAVASLLSSLVILASLLVTSMIIQDILEFENELMKDMNQFKASPIFLFFYYSKLSTSNFLSDYFFLFDFDFRLRTIH